MTDFYHAFDHSDTVKVDERAAHVPMPWQRLAADIKYTAKNASLITDSSSGIKQLSIGVVTGE